MDLNILLLFEIFILVIAQDDGVLYDAYFAHPITTKRGDYLTGVTNGTGLCTVLVKPCQKHEDRRIDGTCTNPHYPFHGASKTPFARLLPPDFSLGYGLPTARDGSDLPSARLLRTSLIRDGFAKNHKFSVLATHAHAFSVADSVDLYYLLTYVIVSDCCIGNTPNRVNPKCMAIPVPSDDPYLQSSSVRCLNLTRIETYQDNGCVPPTLPPKRYNRHTPLLDLSVIYGYTEERSRQIRAFEGGLLSFRMEGDREVPAGHSNRCLGNQPPAEVVCYNFGQEQTGNIIGGNMLMSLWFFREHNRLARKLAELNPCWDDEKLFKTSREINIAQWQYIYFYELIPELMGRKNALAEGIIHETKGYVNDFDHRYAPAIYREFTVGIRWFHNYLDGYTELYRNGTYVGRRFISEDFLRTGIMPINNTEADLTEGSFMQPAARFDDILDAQLTHKSSADYQLVSDLGSTDIMRGRDAGFKSYNDYRELCGMKAAEKWEDFHDTIDKGRVLTLQRIYDDVDDVELMVAIYIEKWLPDTYVGPTLYCIMTHNLLLWRKSDRFFFEHGDIPTALTIPQLNEIRKTSISRIVCNNGDQVTHMQPHGMFKISEWNSPVSCRKIQGVDLRKWKEKTGTTCPTEIPTDLTTIIP